MNEKIQPPSVNELAKAIKNTISKKAMADDNMLQNLFCHKNLLQLIATQEEYKVKFLNRKLNASERIDKEEYIKKEKETLIFNIAKNLKVFWDDIFKNNKTLP